MKQFIIGLTLGLLFTGLTAFAAEKIIINPANVIMSNAGGVYFSRLYTTKVNTPEGTYRLFVLEADTGSSIEAIKISGGK